MAGAKVLVVEDDYATLDRLTAALTGEFDLLTTGDPATALASFRNHDPALILLDLGLPPHPADPEEGLRLLGEVRRLRPGCKVIVCTDCGERQDAVRAVSYGAYDFLKEPVEPDLLRQVMRRALWLAELEAEGLALPPENAAEEPIEEMIGASASIRGVFRAIRKVATADVPVLITGETGTGKELTAEAIHRRSLRRDGPFTIINCAAIPETLAESELFGHERGAFTGALQRKRGKLERAHGGTVFLDEIEELSLPVQGKLLRFLQDWTIERVGSQQQIHVDARVIAASNVDLREAISRGKFREDLYFRLSVVTIDLPPVRQRGEDVLLMALAFLRRASGRGRKRLLGFTREAMTAIQAYPWPGNVREVSNKIRRAVVMAEGPYVTATDLDIPSSDGESNSPELSLRTARRQLEATLILRAAAFHDGNVTRVAEELGVSRPTVYALLRKLGIRSRSSIFRGRESRCA